MSATNAKRKIDMEPQLKLPVTFKAVEMLIEHLATTDRDNLLALDCLFLNYMKSTLELFAKSLNSPVEGLDNTTINTYMVSARDVVEKLNKIHALDPSVLNTLYKHRVKVSNQEVDVVVDENDTCSFLGILNGLFPFKGGTGAIALILNDDMTTIERFAVGQDAMEWVESQSK